MAVKKNPIPLLWLVGGGVALLAALAPKEALIAVAPGAAIATGAAKPDAPGTPTPWDKLIDAGFKLGLVYVGGKLFLKWMNDDEYRDPPGYAKRYLRRKQRR